MIVGSRQEGDEMPAAVNVVDEEIPTVGNVVEEEMKFEGFEWAALPQYGETAAGPPMDDEEEKDHFMTFGCDPHGDEPTGVDEEWRYFNNVDSSIPDVQPIDYMEVEVQKRKSTRPIPEFDTERVPDDEAVMVDDHLVPHTTHDKENPVIKEGDTFREKDDFISTMRTYAIKNEFETRVEHSDKDRYRARCADANCDWRVFAKKLHGGNTFVVVKLSKLDDHTWMLCYSS
ncbi:unnamed protein product [Urochloa decumbens]|uniref:Transposase MuDR plant domain-containing protein n=1 Tax=Urochloa decumbens TaxID=240449 RepID=A0ABC9AJU5_9POAL